MYFITLIGNTKVLLIKSRIIRLFAENNHIQLEDSEMLFGSGGEGRDGGPSLHLNNNMKVLMIFGKTFS